jgi:hypothetical protein
MDFSLALGAKNEIGREEMDMRYTRENEQSDSVKGSVMPANLAWRSRRCAAAVLTGFLLAMGSGPGNAEAAAVPLIRDGRSPYVIVTPGATDARGLVQRAAETLQQFLRDSTGCTLPIVTEDKLPAGTPAIFLGRTRTGEAAGLPLAGLEEWAFLKRVIGPNLFLAGNDASVFPDAADMKLRNSYEYCGTMKAVLSFLEEEAGVRFVMAGPYGRVMPKRADLAVSSDLNVFHRNDFTYIIGRDPGDQTYALANNFYRTPPVKSYGGHSYYAAVPAGTWAKNNPEYFALIVGKRDWSANHLCISNPDVQRLMIEEMVRQFDQGYEWVELAQTDGYRACECEKCAAIHPDEGERLWIIHRKLAEEMKRLRPDRKVMIISYGPTRHPPTSFGDFPDNVVIQMCTYTPEAFSDWAKFKVPKTVYAYNWGTYFALGFGPKRTPRYAIEQVRLFRKNNVQGIYFCGGFELPGIEGPTYYAYGRALGDAGAESDAVLSDYCAHAFGRAQAPMKAFFDTLHSRLDLFCLFNRPNIPNTAHLVEWANPFRTPEDAYLNLFPARVINALQTNLDRARAAENDEAVQARLRLVQLEFDYVKHLATGFHLYQTYRLRPNSVTFDMLAAALDDRRAWIDGLFEESGALRRVDGWPKVFNNASKATLLAGGRGSAQLSAPFNWDTSVLRAKGVLPGAGTKKMSIPSRDGIQVDGILNEAAWQDLPVHELGEIGMGALKNATRFKVARDEQAIYFAVECDLDAIDDLKLDTKGQDGMVHRQECVEIVLDPFGDRQKYYHFIFNPILDSFYDAAIGFIEDPLDPRYNKPDRSWNGPWSYAAAMDRANKRWTAEVRIPFAGLGVAVPRPETTWTLNVGRAEYPGNDHKGSPVLSLWSPNLEARSFHDCSTFGEAVFE